MVSPLSPIQTQAQPDQTLNSLLAGRQSFQQSQLNNQAMQRNQMMMDRAPIENAQQDQMAQQQISRADYDTAVQRLSVINRLAKKVKELPQDQRQGFVQSLNPEMLKSVGVDLAQVSGVQLDDQSLEALIAQTGSALPDVAATAGQREFDSMASGLSKEEREKARRIQLGLDPRAVGSSAITTAVTPGMTEIVAGSEATITGDKAGAAETAKLNARLDKLPKVKAAVLAAEQQVKELGDKRTTASQNQIAMRMYETAMQGLVSGLEGTETGAIAGRLPAITANQQIAEGAVAAVAPILKATFRTSGEGTFTDKDQELLMAMVPTRTDEPEARAAKINNINAIIAAKLNINGSPESAVGVPSKASKYTIEVMD